MGKWDQGLGADSGSWQSLERRSLGRSLGVLRTALLFLTLFAAGLQDFPMSLSTYVCDSESLGRAVPGEKEGRKVQKRPRAEGRRPSVWLRQVSEEFLGSWLQ